MEGWRACPALDGVKRGVSIVPYARVGVSAPIIGWVGELDWLRLWLSTRDIETYCLGAEAVDEEPDWLLDSWFPLRESMALREERVQFAAVCR